MTLACTRCEGTGFINLHQVDDNILKNFDNTWDHELILNWIKKNKDHDVSICDCCGDTENWYGDPGQHYSPNDPQGNNGPYEYNGGLCECH